MATIAMLGSGEFQPWTQPVDSWCLDRSTVAGDRVLVIPAASAPEGDAVFDRWATMGLDHYAGMGLRPEVLAMKTRADASDPAIAEAVAGARLLFFSGGNPGYLAETIAGTPFADALATAIADGVAVAGCSAGAVLFGALCPFIDGEDLQRWVEGARILPHAFVLPHFDALEGYQPGLREMLIAMCPPGCVVVGIDEDTALYGDGETWTVAGAGAAWLGGSDDGDLRAVRAGGSTVLRLTPALA